MFDNLNISDKCANALENAVKTGRLSHAVILEGADGDIRLNCAKELLFAKTKINRAISAQAA